MRKLLLFLLVAMPALAAVTSATFRDPSHSAVMVSFSADTAFNEARVRYIPTASGSCTAGIGGIVQFPSGISTGSVTSFIVSLSGLTPDTQYQICPEVSSNSGSTWSTGFGVNFTTQPLPAIHPALPISPNTFDTSYPDTTQGTCWSTGLPGYCSVTVTVSGTSCSDLISDINTAIAHQTTGGTVVNIPAGSDCIGKVNWSQMAPDVLSFNPSEVNSVDPNSIHMPAHGFSEGQGVVFGPAYYNAMGGVYYGYAYFVHVLDADNFQLYKYWQQFQASITNGSTTIHVENMLGGTGRACGFQDLPNGCGVEAGSPVVGAGIPAGATIVSYDTVAGTATLSQAATATASGVTLTMASPNLATLTPGTDTSQAFIPWPRNSLYWVIVRTSTPDSQFAPVGTRVNPSWLPKMATLQMPETTSFVNNSTDSLISFGGWDHGSTAGESFASHIRFVGLQLTWTTPTELSSSPVDHTYLLIDNNEADSDLILDRCWFHNPNTHQDRVYIGAEIAARNFAIINSYIDNMNQWFPQYNPGGGPETTTGVAPTASGTTLTIPAYSSIYYGANEPASLPDGLTVTWTGEPDASITSPELVVYFDMTGGLHVVAPHGITVIAPGSTITSTTTGGTPTCHQGDPLLPETSFGRLAAAPLACISLGADGTVTGSIPTPSIDRGHATEGAIFFQVLNASGDGPYIFTNNYFEVEGTNALMFQDSGGAGWASDFTIDRNDFVMSLNHMLGSINSKLAQASIPTDGYDYGVRQFLEWKGGQRIQIDGNIFDSNYHEDTQAPNPTITDYGGATITDVDVTNNTWRHLAGGPGIPSGTGACANCPPSYRVRYNNNLFWDLNGVLYATGTGATWGNSPWDTAGGYLFPGGDRAAEDIEIDHNTVVDDLGFATSLIYWTDAPAEGLQIDNNLLSYNVSTHGDYYLFMGGADNNNACTPGETSAAFACFFPGVEMKNNVFVPGWNYADWPLGSSVGPGANANGQVTAAHIASTLGSFAADNTVLADSSVSGSMDAVKWYDPTFTSGQYGSDGFYDGPVPNFHLKSASPYNAVGTDGLQAGVNMNKLLAAQGAVTLVGANQITTDSANITYIAPDSDACAVDYSSSDPMLINSFTRVSDSGGSRVRNVSLTGLSAGTSYSYRVDCAVVQPTGKFATN